MRKITRRRLFSGLSVLVLGVLFNPWTAAWLFSVDGQLETGSKVLVLGSEVLLVGIGLLVLLASRSALTGIIVSVVAGLIALVVVDLAARAFLKSALYYRPEDIYKRRLPEFPSHSLFERNVSYTGETWGDLAAMTTRDELREIRTVNFVTDNYGYRNDVLDTTRPLDLIILGDSFGSGAGTSQEDMWDAHFRKTYGLNVYNLSIPGFSPWHELVTLKRELGKLKVGPQTTVLWAIFGGNDFDESGLRDLNPSEVGLLRQWHIRLRTFYRRSPIKILTERVLFHEPAEMVMTRDSAVVSYLPDGRTFLFYSLYVGHDRRTYEEVQQLPAIARMRAEFADMKRFADKAGVRVLVAHLPTSYSIYGWVLDSRPPWSDSLLPASSSLVLQDLCQESGLAFLDLRPPMLRAARQLFDETGELLWWRDDTHWNRHGHEVAAKIIGDWLKSNDSAQYHTAQAGEH